MQQGREGQTLGIKAPLGKLQGLQEAAVLRDLNCREEGKLFQHNHIPWLHGADNELGSGERTQVDVKFDGGGYTK